MKYKTGEICPQKGTYVFAGYTDGTNKPAPTQEEHRIPLEVGEVFPPIRSTSKGAWWVKA